MKAEPDPEQHESNAKRYLEQTERHFTRPDPQGLYYPVSQVETSDSRIEVNATLTHEGTTPMRPRNSMTNVIVALANSLSALIALGTLVGLIFTVKLASQQWLTMNATLDEMRSQTAAARQSQQDTNEFFKTDERAWLEVVPEVIPTKPLPPVQGMNFPPLFDYRFAIKNTGKTAAKIVKVGDNNRSVLNGKDTRAGVELSQESQLLPRPAPAILVPGSDIPWVLRGIMQPNSTASDGRLILHQYVGRIDYEDIFGVAHWVTFCYQLHDDATPAMCEFGNDGDSEKPRKR